MFHNNLKYHPFMRKFIVPLLLGLIAAAYAALIGVWAINVRAVDATGQRSMLIAKAFVAAFLLGFGLQYLIVKMILFARDHSMPATRRKR